jgi:hypothetical protein
LVAFAGCQHCSVASVHVLELLGPCRGYKPSHAADESAAMTMIGSDVQDMHVLWYWFVSQSSAKMDLLQPGIGRTFWGFAGATYIIGGACLLAMTACSGTGR